MEYGSNVEQQLRWPWQKDQAKMPELAESGNENVVSFSGVELEKGAGGPNTPHIERFENNTITEFDHRLMQKIAVAWELNQPVLIESGSGLGKSETVERMAAELQWDVYYANCHDFEPDVLIGAKTVREDTKSGFGWKDGIVIQAIRNGGVLFLDEYNFMRGETRGRLHEILDSVLRGKDEVILIENDGERIKVHPDLRIVAAQNPPGGEFSDREVLDPAQISRFVYLKEPSAMPSEIKEARAMGYLNGSTQAEAAGTLEIQSNHRANAEDIKTHKDAEEVVKQYLKFEHTVSEMLERRELGRRQPQPIYLAFQRDFNRVMGFVEKYHDHEKDDLFGTMKKALHYYFENRFEAREDRQKIVELINLIGEKPVADPTRYTPDEVATPSPTAVPSAGGSGSGGSGGGAGTAAPPRYPDDWWDDWYN